MDADTDTNGDAARADADGDWHGAAGQWPLDSEVLFGASSLHDEYFGDWNCTAHRRVKKTLDRLLQKRKPGEPAAASSTWTLQPQPPAPPRRAEPGLVLHVLYDLLRQDGVVRNGVRFVELAACLKRKARECKHDLSGSTFPAAVVALQADAHGGDLAAAQQSTLVACVWDASQGARRIACGVLQHGVAAAAGDGTPAAPAAPAATQLWEFADVRLFVPAAAAIAAHVASPLDEALAVVFAATLADVALTTCDKREEQDAAGVQKWLTAKGLSLLLAMFSEDRLRNAVLTACTGVGLMNMNRIGSGGGSGNSNSNSNSSAAAAASCVNPGASPCTSLSPGAKQQFFKKRSSTSAEAAAPPVLDADAPESKRLRRKRTPRHDRTSLAAAEATEEEDDAAAVQQPVAVYDLHGAFIGLCTLPPSTKFITGPFPGVADYPDLSFLSQDDEDAAAAAEYAVDSEWQFGFHLDDVVLHHEAVEDGHDHGVVRLIAAKNEDWPDDVCVDLV